MSRQLASDARLDARDLRTGGRWTAGQTLKNASIRVLIRALLWIADRLPQAWLSGLCRVAGRAAWWSMPRARRVALNNLARVLPAGEANEIARRSFDEAGRNLALCLLTRRAGFRVLDRLSVDAASRARFDRAIGEGRGVVFVSAHLGPFEWVAAAIAELGYSASVVVRESYDPKLDPIVDAHRLARGLSVIHRGDPHAPLAIVRALRSGRAVGVLPDLGGRVAGVAVDFLGARSIAPLGPARLAHRTGAAMVVGTLAGRELHIERIELASDEAATTQRVMSALEGVILRWPADWLWMARDLRSAPDLATKPGGR